ncbi:MAG: efflux RND transporter permease subunit [Spirochaetota bacterium]|nr:efflux RND transporter permease subunit [Spirochaetota bacterium]
MWLANTFIKRSVFATMMVSGLVLIGLVCFPLIGVDLFPKVDFPVVSVTTILKGASPEIMDIDVTDKIEEAVNGINGVKSITSTSVESRSVVIVEFVLERNIDLALQDVREKVAAVRYKLPSDIEDPIIGKIDPAEVPILWLALSSDKFSERDLSTYADEVLKSQFQRLNGVGAIQMGGLRLRQVRIWLDADKMASYKITAHDLINSLKRENVELPGGRIESKTKEYSLKVKGEFRTPQSFNQLIIGYYNNSSIRLKDIGYAEDGMDERRSIARFNKKTAIALGIQKQSGTNTVEVIDKVKKELISIDETLPPGMKVNISFDQSLFIKRSINEVQFHLVYGGFFAVLAVFLFLKSVRTTIISALAIPTSIIATFTIIYAFDFTFNNMSMLALSLSIGILIDDAIIVIENIHRHIESGIPAKQAASSGTGEIGQAVVATTLAIVAIFFPFAFVKGLIGRFFVQFALTIVFAVLVSMFISFTLTPMLASKFLLGIDKQNKKKKYFSKLSSLLDTYYNKLETLYSMLLRLALAHRAIVIISSFLIFLFSIYITNFLGKEFLPHEDQGQFSVRMQAPPDYSFDKIEQLFKKVEVHLSTIPEIKSIFFTQGLDGEVNKGFIFVSLVPQNQRNKHQEQIKTEIRKDLSKITALQYSVENISMVGGGQRSTPIIFSIRGSDLSLLEAYAKRIAKGYSELAGIVDVETSIEDPKPEIKIYVDRIKAADLGVDVTSIAETINILVGGEITITKFKDESKGKRYDVRARLLKKDRYNPKDVEKLYVRSKDGRLIQLSSLIHIHEGAGPSSIRRLDRLRAVSIFANLENKPLGEAKTDLDNIAAKILPLEYTGKYKGMAEMMGESFKYLTYALILGVFFAYMILAAQFENYLHPIIVLLSMPFSFIGAFGALFLAGMTLNIFSFIGLILLMGLVKKNAILLVDYTNTLRKKGLEKREAILKAGPIRLKPILMTTVAMVMGMLPIAIGTGEGSETRAPMAVATIGGLLTSLFLTLVVVPVAYDLLDAMKVRIKGLKKKT